MPYRMKKHVIFGVAALVAAAVPMSVKADADAFPWKLFKGFPDGTWRVVQEYATEAACRSDGESMARELTASNCTYAACAVPVLCVDKRAASISAFPGSTVPANGLVMLFGKAKLADAEKLYKEAGRCKPADAMQKLDAEHAREEADG